MNIGENMRRARKEAGISQQDMAKRIGAHQKDISLWENGKHIPSAEVVAKWCEAAGVTADYIMEERPKKKMKHKIGELLSEEGIMPVNDLFELHHWILDPEIDVLGRDGEYLELRTTTAIKGTAQSSRRIESRDTKGIMEETEKAMSEMMDEIKDIYCRRWRGGLA